MVRERGCMCGDGFFHHYRFMHGALYRFSFHHTGEVTGIQLLGRSLRLVLDLRSHTCIPEAVYVKIALTARLKDEPCDAARLKAEIIEERGLWGRLGFLEKGMRRPHVVRLLGAPRAHEPGKMEFVGRTDRWLTAVVLHLDADGSFQGFRPGWCHHQELPPQRGSVRWIIEKIAYDGRSEVEDYDVGPLTDADVAYFFDHLAHLVQHATPEEWEELTKALVDLYNRGHRDARVPGILRQRFLDPHLSERDARWLLHESDPDRSQDAYIERDLQTLRLVQESNDTALGHPQFLTYIDSEHPEKGELILKGTDSPNNHIRQTAYAALDEAAGDKVVPKLRAGLADPVVAIRETCAWKFASSRGTKADLALLRSRLAVEEAVGVRRGLMLAIERLGEEP